MDAFLESLERSSNAAQVTKNLYKYYRSLGFIGLSRATFSTEEPAMLDFVQIGLPKEWLAVYQEHKAEFIQPISMHVMRTGETGRWWDIAGELFDPDFVSGMRSQCPGDGFILPTYGPTEHCCLTFVVANEGTEALESADLSQLIFAAQTAHIVLDRLQFDEQNQSLLSERETEVLFWIARGKSNVDIAAILELSPDTVGTYVRRIFEKLDVSDRTQAAIQGIRKHLISAPKYIEKQAG